MPAAYRRCTHHRPWARTQPAVTMKPGHGNDNQEPAPCGSAPVAPRILAYGGLLLSLVLLLAVPATAASTDEASEPDCPQAGLVPRPAAVRLMRSAGAGDPARPTRKPAGLRLPGPPSSSTSPRTPGRPMPSGAMWRPGPCRPTAPRIRPVRTLCPCGSGSNPTGPCNTRCGRPGCRRRTRPWTWRWPGARPPRPTTGSCSTFSVQN